MVEENKLWTDKLSCFHETLFPIIFLYLIFSPQDRLSASSVGVVFMCVRPCLCTCGHASLVEIPLCLYVCLIDKNIEIKQGWGSVLFHFIFLLTHSVFQDSMKLEVCSFGFWSSSDIIVCRPGEAFSTTILDCNANNNYIGSPSHITSLSYHRARNNNRAKTQMSAPHEYKTDDALDAISMYMCLSAFSLWNGLSVWTEFLTCRLH